MDCKRGGRPRPHMNSTDASGVQILSQVSLGHPTFNTQNHTAHTFKQATVQHRPHHSQPHFLNVRGNTSSTQPHQLRLPLGSADSKFQRWYSASSASLLTSYHAEGGRGQSSLTMGDTPTYTLVPSSCLCG